MKCIELATFSAEKNPAATCYLIAQTLLVSDLHAPLLEPFATGERGRWAEGFVGTRGLLEAGGTITYSGLGWIGNRWREIVSQRISTGYRIAIDGIGAFFVASSGKRVHQIERSDFCTSSMLVEAALGPVLILALALQELFCLHAGAVITAEKGVAFVAESGFGKSTLAGWMGASCDDDSQRISDDILPLALGQGSLLALSHFPQLKLPADQQPILHAPAAFPLHTVYVLDKDDPQVENGVELQPMTGAEAAVALLQHTVAARLFDQELLAQHLTFCTEAAARIKVRRLSYRRSFDVLPVVREVIMADLDDHY